MAEGNKEFEAKAEDQMSSFQALASKEREALMGCLSPQQMELLKKCNLQFEPANPERPGSIKGQIDGKEVVIIYKRTGNERGESTVDGVAILPSLANKLFEKYQYIAEMQTKSEQLDFVKIKAEAAAQDLLSL